MYRILTQSQASFSNTCRVSRRDTMTYINIYYTLDEHRLYITCTFNDLTNCHQHLRRGFARFISIQPEFSQVFASFWNRFTFHPIGNYFFYSIRNMHTVFFDRSRKFYTYIYILQILYRISICKTGRKILEKFLQDSPREFL